MPAISKGDKVLVTGVNGYIAMWTARLLLERGYAVRGTLRSEAKAKFVKDYFTTLGCGDRLEIAIVNDISKPGAFDETVMGVDAVAHMASPVGTALPKDPGETLQPAIRGTIGVFESTLKHGQKIKRIILTSSCAAVLPPVTERPTVFSDLDWDTEHPKIIAERGFDAPPVSIYCASKTLSERAAWEYYEKHKASTQWDFCVINPPFVYGPPIHEIPSISSLNFSLALWYDAVLSKNPKTKEALSVSDSWIDVRDIALAHVLALENPAASGERIIASAGGYIWQEWLDTANSLPHSSRKLDIGFPEITEVQKVYNILYDKSKEERILGIKHRTMQETTKDSLEYFTSRGW